MINRVKTTEQAGEVEVIEDIPLKLEIQKVMLRMLVRGEKPGFEKEASKLVKMVQAVARPRAAYKISRINGKTRGSLTIDGTRFSSYLLRINLDKTDTVFPYAVTTGSELDALHLPVGTSSRSYCLEILKGMVLVEATDYLRDYLLERYHLDYLFSLSPGEYQAWPVINQGTLLSILGDVKKLIGVTLAADGTTKTSQLTSGLFYYVETKFENCQLCVREPCMMRRVPFSLELTRHLKLTPHTLCVR
jgi:hypothetical protein